MTLVRRGTQALLLLALAVASPVPCAAGSPPVSVLFFFTVECPHCAASMPRVDKVARRYPVRGIVLNASAGDLAAARAKFPASFPLVAGDNAVRDSYGIKGVPTAVIVSGDGAPREKLAGESAIEGLAEVLDAIARGGKGILEIRKGADTFAGKEVSVTGWLVRVGGWPGSRTAWFLTNRVEKIRVTPWHPVPGGLSPDRGGDDPMSRYEEKIVTVRGIVKASGDGVVIESRDGRLLR